MNKGSVLTEDKISEIRRRYAEGESSYKLAGEFYMSQKGLYAYVSDIKRPTKYNRGISDKRKQQIRAAYLMGVKTGMIAEAAGLHRTTVHRYTKDLRKGT
jgi:DNA invertase Pin-like site-specific DNA recombinase